ncbi:hypothetical protein [Ruminococcus albus]|uniref:Uncharacterized protein n=1 Tax=Ruminococcus albus TaxID=1264 RepID=A0A1I1N254_RUMAL|nr:hypothetical protein [Ruminococcus albus]SFC91717.1 hypothetical protein SAMN02910406_02661 [Ruminococcus albus]
MLRLKKKHIKTIIVLAIVVCFWAFIYYSFNRYFKRSTELYEKTTFTAQETKNLWTELGLKYIDLDISKAYFNFDRDLYVISEAFDSIDAEIKYLKQVKENENVHAVNDTLAPELSSHHDGKELYEIFDIRYGNDFGNIRCFTYEENGKYYMEFHKSRAGYNEDYNLHEMFGLK